jgi:hypothetical protein
VAPPSGLQSLTCSSCFKQGMEKVDLPSGLQNSTSGFDFNQSALSKYVFCEIYVFRNICFAKYVFSKYVFCENKEHRRRRLYPLGCKA